jgi:chitodextrinase
MDPISKNIKRISEAMSDHARRLRRLETRSHPTTANNDTVPPTTPTNFAGSAISYHQIQLTWTASTDDKGVAGYTIYRGGVKIGSTTSLSYNDYGVSGGSAYSYTIDAYDFGKNYSAKTSPLVIATPAQPDTTAPSQPTGLQYTALSTAAVSLAWTASTDNIGVAGYYVYRDGVQISQPATNSYQDVSLSPSTNYSYQVAAYDAAGNVSTRSSAINITTPALPPPTTGGFYASLTGSSSNDGSISAPWTLAYALNGAGGGLIVAGSTLYIRAGTYDLTAAQVVTGFSGTVSNHISIKPYTGEHVIIRNVAATTFNTLEIRDVSYTDFYDLEITATGYTRTSEAGSEVAMAHVYENASYTQSHMRWLDCKFHDAPGKAYRFAATSDYSELNGCALYFNGSSSTYDPCILGVSNAGKIKIIRDCVILDNASEGIKLYSSDTTGVNNFTVSGNAVINSGVLYNKASRDMIAAGVSVAPRDISFTSNNTYNYLSVSATARSLQIGHVGTTGGGGTGAPLTLIQPNITGTAYYVSTTGSDSNPGTLASPFLTIDRGLQAVSPGGVVYVRGGHYVKGTSGSQPNGHYWNKSGTSASARVHLMAYPGETPILDSTTQHQSIPYSYTPYVIVYGDYMYISGFQVLNAYGMGIHVRGNYNVLDNIFINVAQMNGILIGGDHNTVQLCRLWRACNDNYLGGTTDGFWASGLTCARGSSKNGTTITTDTTFVGCTVWETWGEGISSFEATQSKFYDCVSHDCSSTNFYGSDSTYVDFQRCMSWHDPASTDIYNGPGDKGGFTFGCENKQSIYMHHFNILNCIAYNDRRNFYWWGAGTNSPSMDNYYIANNTFLNSQTLTNGHGNVTVGGSVNHINSTFINNIVEQDNSFLIAVIINTTGLTIDHNIWSNNTGFSSTGTNALITDPLLTKNGSPFDPNYYKLQSGSPARDSGAAATGVTVDFFRIDRSGTTDRGASEYSTGSASDSGAVNIAGTSNYLVGQAVDLAGSAYNNVTFSSNNMYYPQASIGDTETRYPNNLWSKTYPTTAPIVRTRVYEFDHKKALIVAYNWSASTSITVTAADLAGMDLAVGSSYVLHNYENYYADTVTGTYNGTSIVIPLTGHTRAAPIGGLATPISIMPNFSAWQIVAQGGTVPPVPVVGGVIGMLAGLTYGNGVVAGDSEPPTTPGSVTSTWVSSTAQDISWSASTDNVAVTGYTIYRNGIAYDTTASTTYHDTALSEGAFYDYQVDAYDAADNHSTLSSHVYSGLWASPTGTSGNSGSYASPWSFVHVLNGGAGGTIPAGATVFLKEGTYTNLDPITVTGLSGSSGHPIVIRAEPGKRVTIRQDYNGSYNLLYFGNVSYISFYDLEMAGYGYTRTTDQTILSSMHFVGFNTAYNQSNIKFYNCVLHDCLGAAVVSPSTTRGGIELNGCMIYYNGQSSSLDHGVTALNTDTYVFSMTHSTLHNNSSSCFKSYADDTSVINDIHIDGCVMFNPGSLYSQTNNTYTFSIGSWLVSSNSLTVQYNHLYSPTSNSTYSMRIGRTASGYNVTNSVISNNYIVGKPIDMSPTGWTGNTVNNNTIYCNTTLNATTQGRLDAGTGNTVSTVPASGLNVFVDSYSWDTKRAVIAIHNFSASSSVTITNAMLTGGGVSISNGNSYELHNSENYYGDVITGTYNGTSITVGMSGRTQAAPVGGISTPATAFPYFGSFVLIVS